MFLDLSAKMSNALHCGSAVPGRSVVLYWAKLELIWWMTLGDIPIRLAKQVFVRPVCCIPNARFSIFLLKVAVFVKFLNTISLNDLTDLPTQSRK